MKIQLWLIGKTSFPYLNEGLALYENRLRHYLPFQTITFSDLKNTRHYSPNQWKQTEADQVLKKLRPDDFLILLDERGQAFRSVEFAKFMEQKLQLSSKRIIFLTGGAFGFSERLLCRADFKLSLSKMTFSHQMVRLFFLEQLYRAMTILRGESYHNE